MLVSSSGPWASPEFVCTPLCLSTGAWTHAKRQAFITWSEVFHLKQNLSLDADTPPQVNKDLGKERRGDVWGGEALEERRHVVTLTHVHCSVHSQKCAHGPTITHTLN